MKAGERCRELASDSNARSDAERESRLREGILTCWQRLASLCVLMAARYANFSVIYRAEAN